MSFGKVYQLGHSKLITEAHGRNNKGHEVYGSRML